MPKKRARTKSKKKLSWRILFASFVPVLLVFFLLLNSSNNENVLGKSDTNLFNLGKSFFNSTNSGKPECKKVRPTSIAFSDPCDSKGNIGFSTVSYTCSDGTSGNISNACINPQSVLEKIRKICSKNSVCPKPSISPKPTLTKSPELESE